MKNIKSLSVILGLILSISCTEEVPLLDFIETAPCSSENIIIDPTIISDFECQFNAELPGVERIQVNPKFGGINQSKFVGKYIDPAAPWDFLLVKEDEASLDLSVYNIFKIKIKTVITGELIVKLEGGSSPAKELKTQVNGNGEWIEYTFDFKSQFQEKHNKLILFINAGTETSGTDEYFIDDLRFAESSDPCINVTPDTTIINDFDCQKNKIFVDDEVALKPNPNTNSDLNSSIFSGRYTDEVGAWDALIIDFANQVDSEGNVLDESPIDLSENNSLSINIYAPVTGTLKIKLEGGSSSPIEVDNTISKTNEWVNYIFNFSGQEAANHTKLVLFFNAGVDTDGTHEYFIDDLKFEPYTSTCEGIEVDLAIVNDFECQQNYQNTCCGVPTEIIDNPSSSGINTSSSVFKVTDNGTAPWEAVVFTRDADIDLTVNNHLRIKMLSTTSGTLLAKLEGGTSAPVELSKTMDDSGEWKEYAFDFSAQANENHKSIVFFFNAGGSDGTTEDLYYIDDIKFGVAPPTPTIRFPFENDYVDAISSNTATEVGSPSFGTGYVGNNAYEGAADSYLTFPSATLTSSTEFSTTFWYKVNAAPDRSGILVIGDLDAEDRTSGLRLFREGSPTEQRIKLNVGFGSGESWNDGGVINPASGWVHIAVVVSETESSIYFDGVLVNSATFDTPIDWTNVTDTITIGSGAPTFSYWGHSSDTSLIDELALYDKALTQKEVEASMITQ